MSSIMPSRAERRALMKEKSKLTVKQKLEISRRTLELGKKIQAAYQDAWDTAELQSEAERNSASLKSMVDMFGEEKGRDIHNNNMVLKGELEDKRNNF